MPDEHRDCCKRCDAYLPHQDGGAGLCRSKPPSANGIPWPVVREFDWCREFRPPDNAARTEGIYDLPLARVLPNGWPALKAVINDLGAKTLRELASCTAEQIETVRAARGRCGGSSADPANRKLSSRSVAGDLTDVRRLLALAGFRLKGE